MFAYRFSAIAAAAACALAMPASATTTHKVLSTILESGNTGQTLGSGYTTMETAGAQCYSATCTVSMQIMATVGNATCTDLWKIVGLVDGTSIDGGPYQSGLPKSGNYQVRIWRGEYPVSRGSHTLAFQLYLPCSANAYQWSVDYMITKP